MEESEETTDNPIGVKEIEEVYNHEKEQSLSDFEIDRLAELVAEKLKMKCGCEIIQENIIEASRKGE